MRKRAIILIAAASLALATIPLLIMLGGNAGGQGEGNREPGTINPGFPEVPSMRLPPAVRRLLNKRTFKGVGPYAAYRNYTYVGEDENFSLGAGYMVSTRSEAVETVRRVVEGLGASMDAFVVDKVAVGRTWVGYGYVWDISFYDKRYSGNPDLVVRHIKHVNIDAVTGAVTYIEITVEGRAAVRLNETLSSGDGDQRLLRLLLGENYTVYYGELRVKERYIHSREGIRYVYLYDQYYRGMRVINYPANPFSSIPCAAKLSATYRGGGGDAMDILFSFTGYPLYNITYYPAETVDESGARAFAIDYFGELFNATINITSLGVEGPFIYVDYPEALYQVYLVNATVSVEHEDYSVVASIQLAMRGRDDVVDYRVLGYERG